MVPIWRHRSNPTGAYPNIIYPFIIPGGVNPWSGFALLFSAAVISRAFYPRFRLRAVIVVRPFLILGNINPWSNFIFPFLVAITL